MSTVIDLDRAVRPDLSGRRVVIPGGTGSVGEGIVRAWLAAGADVVVPSRTQGRADQFTEVLGELAGSPRLHLVVGDYTDFDTAEAMAARITGELGEVTDVVASIGGWWQGRPLWEVTTQEWSRWFVGLTTAHVAQVRAWIPRLGKRGSYQLVLGGSAVTPVPGASLINMEQAALLMMRQVLSAEVGDQRRVVSTVLGPVDTRLRRWVDPSWVSGDEVGLLSTGVAPDERATGVDYVLRTKDQMLEALRSLGVHSGAADAGE